MIDIVAPMGGVAAFAKLLTENVLKDETVRLSAAVQFAVKSEAARINARNEWTGHLWQGRFGSVVMEEAHLYAAFVYVALNPVRARLVKRAEDWKWSRALI